MRLAVPVWSGRVSPLLDAATRLLVVEVIGGEPTFTEVYPLDGPDRANAVAELGVETLVCGAVSRELEDRLVASGVEVIAGIRGDANEVIRAQLEGGPNQVCFRLPGCRARRRRARSRELAMDRAGHS